MANDSVGGEASLPPPKRVRRHRFRTFKERVSEVDIDVYKSLVPRRDAPLPGSSSFFQEKLTEWRELNASHEWLECYKEVQSLCTTLPQLIHHQEDVVNAIVGRLHMENSLSLEPLLDLVAVLSRDLASDFLPHMEKVVLAMSDIVVSQGGERDPEVLGYIYRSLSAMCKNLARYLVLDLKPMLKLTAGLRAHKSQHVRKFTADALGFLVRRAKDAQAEEAIEYLYHEGVDGMSQPCCDGNGEIFASSIKGVNHGLYSRSERILGMIFNDALTPSVESLSKEEQAWSRSAVYYMRQCSLKSCFEHVRERELLIPMWSMLVAYCNQVVGVLIASSDAGNSDPHEYLEAGRALTLARVAVAHRGGSRVMRDLNVLLDALSVCMDPRLYGHQTRDQHAIESSTFAEYTCPSFEHASLLLVSDVISVANKRKDTRYDLQGLYGAWSRALERSTIDHYLEFVIRVLASGAASDVFIPLAVEKIVCSDRAHDLLVWDALLRLCEHAWSSGALLGGASSNFAKLDAFMRGGLASERDEIIWAALKCSKSIYDRWEDASEFFALAERRVGRNLCLTSTWHESKILLSSRCIQKGQQVDVEKILEGVTRHIDANPRDYFAVKTAALAASDFPGGVVPAPSRVEAMTEVVSQNLVSGSEHLRIKSLELIVSMNKLRGEKDNPLSLLLELETHPLGADSGRHAKVSLGRVQNLIEYARVPDNLVGPTVRGLLGVLYVKLSSHWGPAAKALAAAMSAYPDVAWPLFFDNLISTQKELVERGMFTGTGNPREAEQPSLTGQYSRYRAQGEATSHADAAARLSHLLKALADVDLSVLNKFSKEWVPVMLAFVDGDEGQHSPPAAGEEDEEEEDDDGGEDDAGVEEANEEEEEAQRHVPPRMKRALLRDWMRVVLGFKSLSNFPESKRLLSSVSAHVMDIDPLVQKTAVKVMNLFKLTWLSPYVDKILRFADNKTLRAELTAFPLAMSATSVRANEDAVLEIEKDHRKDLVPLLIAMLFPRMRKRNGRLGGKGAPGSARVAILNFLSGAEPEELSALLELFLLPLSPCFAVTTVAPGASDGRLYLSSRRVDMAWSTYLGKMPGEYWMKHIDLQMLEDQPINRHIGYLNAIHDLISHLGFKMTRYLPEICTLVVKMLQISAKQESREVRIKCIRLLSTILESYPSQAEYSFLWPDLFAAIQPFVGNISTESNAARPPALLELCKSLSESQVLIHVLGDQHDLLGASISALSARHCSDASRSTVLDILENIFDAGAESILSDHIDVLLCGLEDVLKEFRKHRGAAKRCLEILERISSNTTNAETAIHLGRALMNLVTVPKRKWQDDTRRRIDEEMTCRTCRAIAAVWDRIGRLDGAELDGAFSKAPSVLAPLILLLRSQEAKSSLCAAVSSLAGLYPHMAAGASLLGKLHSMSKTSLDEPDYDTRLEAYSSLRGAVWEELCSTDEGMCSMVVYQCCVDLANPSDLSLRHAASRALETLIECKSKHDGSKDDMNLIKRVLMPEVRTRLLSSSLTVRQEHLAIVRKVALTLPQSYPELQSVTHVEDDLDFWSNVCHVQLHRRARAFSRLGEMDAVLVRGYILGLIEKAIVEGVASESGHDAKQIDVDKGSNVTDAAINVLARIGDGLSWDDVQHLLMRYTSLMVAHEDDACIKSIIRASSIILEIISKRDGIEDSRFLVDTVIPSLKGRMVERETVRTPVAMALVKVLKLLPDEYMRSELPRVLQIVCNLLRMRLQRIRDDARKVLAGMAAELGPAYLTFVIQVLKTSLPLRGFTAHVLGYTFHDVLHAVAPAAQEAPGCLDACVPAMVPIIEGDLFTDIADAKEASAFSSSYKESKRCKAYESYRILASLIRVEDTLPRLLEIVWERLPMASTPKLRSKISLLLQHASKGVVENPSATNDNVSEMVYGLLAPVVEEEEARRRLANTELGGGVKAGGQEGLHNHMLAEFAVSTYFSCLKKKVVEVPLQPGMMELLVASLQSRSSQVVSKSLQTVSWVLSRAKDGSIHSDLKGRMARKIVALLRTCSSTLHATAQEGLKALAILAPSVDFKEGEMRFLLEWAFSELASSSEKQGAFVLLKAIVAKKVVLPEVYDVITAVQELLIKSQHGVIRQLSSTVLLSYLLDYPLGKKRLEHHLHFLLSNMGYEHETGRHASIDLLGAIVQKFPQQVLLSWADKLFLVFVTRIVNEESRKLKESVVQLASLLVSRVNYDTRKRLVIDYCGQWVSQGEGVRGGMMRGACLVVMTEAMPAMEPGLLEEFVSRNMASICDDSMFHQHGTSDAMLTHKSLVFLEKVLERDPPVVGGRDALPWDKVASLLVHKHTWVRKAAGRVVGLGLHHACCGASSHLADLFLRQLKELITDDAEADALGAQAVKSLVFLLPSLEDHYVSEVLVRNMVKIADTTSYVTRTQRNYALRFIAASVTRWGAEASQTHLSRLLWPIYRILSDDGDPSQMKELAQDIFSHIKKVVGADVAIAHYNEARGQVQKIRRDRSIGRKLLEHVDPEKAAKLKLHRNRRKKIGRKKKMEDVRRLRDVGVKVKNRISK
ncbi:hypothetical protein M9434_006006 [Picochlorum sp. BPE23]|nr:hypothetical protein M9434_006006 [Picochlorum sp. BPE23]